MTIKEHTVWENEYCPVAKQNIRIRIPLKILGDTTRLGNYNCDERENNRCEYWDTRECKDFLASLESKYKKRYEK